MLETYNGGYTKALLDVQEYIHTHTDTLKRNRCFNEKGIVSLIQCLIDNREYIRDNGTSNLELIYTKDKKFIRKEV